MQDHESRCVAAKSQTDLNKPTRAEASIIVRSFPLVGAALASPASLASDVPAAARRVTACTGSGVPPVRLLVG